MALIWVGAYEMTRPECISRIGDRCTNKSALILHRQEHGSACVGCICSIRYTKTGNLTEKGVIEVL